MCIYIYMYNIYVCMGMYVYIYMCVEWHLYTYIRTYIHVYIYIWMYLCIHYIYAHMYIYMCVYKYRYIYIHIYIMCILYIYMWHQIPSSITFIIQDSIGQGFSTEIFVESQAFCRDASYGNRWQRHLSPPGVWGGADVWGSSLWKLWPCSPRENQNPTSI